MKNNWKETLEDLAIGYAEAVYMESEENGSRLSVERNMGKINSFVENLLAEQKKELLETYDVWYEGAGGNGASFPSRIVVFKGYGK